MVEAVTALMELFILRCCCSRITASWAASVVRCGLRDTGVVVSRTVVSMVVLSSVVVSAIVVSSVVVSSFGNRGVECVSCLFAAAV